MNRGQLKQMLDELNDHQYLFSKDERRLINEATQLVEDGDAPDDRTTDALEDLASRI